MKIKPCDDFASSLRRRFSSLRRQIAHEANLYRRRKDNAIVRRLTLSPFDWFVLFLLLLLMLLAFALGAYRGYKFRGRFIEVRLDKNQRSMPFQRAVPAAIARLHAHFGIGQGLMCDHDSPTVNLDQNSPQ